MGFSKEDLFAVAKNYYDTSDKFHFTTEISPDAWRRCALWEHRASNNDSWYAMMDQLSSALPGYILAETYPSSDAGSRCMIYPPKASRTPTSNWVVVGCVSLLAPVSFVYGVEFDEVGGHPRNPKASFEPLPSKAALPATIVARTIEAVLGYQSLPREVAETPVPLFAGTIAPPETTLFHVLFTNDPSNIP